MARACVSDPIKEVRIMETPRGIIRVHIPDISDEERARRMKEIHDAAAALLRSYYEAHPEEF